MDKPTRDELAAALRRILPWAEWECFSKTALQACRDARTLLSAHQKRGECPECTGRGPGVCPGCGRDTRDILLGLRIPSSVRSRE